MLTKLFSIQSFRIVRETQAKAGTVSSPNKRAIEFLSQVEGKVPLYLSLIMNYYGNDYSHYPVLTVLKTAKIPSKLLWTVFQSVKYTHLTNHKHCHKQY